MDLETIIFDAREDESGNALAAQDIDVLARRYLKALEMEKAAKEAKEAASAAILAKMGELEYLVSKGYRIKRVDVAREQVDYKAVLLAAEVAPSLVARYTRMSRYSYPKFEVIL